VTNVKVRGGVEINFTPGRARVSPVPYNIHITRLDADWLGAGGYDGLYLDRVNIHDAQNAANAQIYNDGYNTTEYPASNLTLVNSWFHGFLQRTNDAHEENLHLGGVQTALIRNNLFEMYPAPVSGTDGYTANFTMEAVVRGVYNRNVTVDKNIFQRWVT
jgi:hypothetical protein